MELSSSSTDSGDTQQQQQHPQRLLDSGKRFGSPVTTTSRCWEGLVSEKRQKVEPVKDDVHGGGFGAWRRMEDTMSEDDEQQQQQLELATRRARAPAAVVVTPQIVVTPPTFHPALSDAAHSRPGCKQFWKAGDYEAQQPMPVVRHQAGHWVFQTQSFAGGIDHVRVHPKFLHSNATSHRWALGAVAELLDNALDEVTNGATYVSVNMIRDPQSGAPMLVIEDDGGGMDPDCMRQCMSLGFSAKSKSANTIGQYGNGFKTSTMRLGADVVVFSRSLANNVHRATQSIGMLSFSFLRQTGHDDIVVPMVDYEIGEEEVWKLFRTSATDWTYNLNTILHWSPYSSEEDLFDQFAGMKQHGTRIVLYNLWEDDQGQLELDFDADPYDIQIRGANRDEKKIMMALRYPNSTHYLTYRHSLRSYVAILYLRLPPGFKIILRGREVQHHSLVDDLMYPQELTYRPQGGVAHVSKESDMMAVVTIGFVKDAKDHVNLQGFNVYHKNRLIKPFWKIWNCTGSDGRGVIGVLEANFVQPAHDKQGFERTTVLARLESRLLQMQKQYWANNCQKVGYVSKKGRKKSIPVSPTGGEVVVHRRQAPSISPPVSEPPEESTRIVGDARIAGIRVASDRGVLLTYGDHSLVKSHRQDVEPTAAISRSGSLSNGTSGVSKGNEPGPKEIVPGRKSLEDLGRMFVRRAAAADSAHVGQVQQVVTPNDHCRPSVEIEILKQLKEENYQLRERCRRLEEATDQSLMFEVDRNRKLEAQQEAVDRRCLEKCIRERDSLKAALEEERQLRESDDEEMRRKLKVALLRVRELEAENNRLRLAMSCSI
ncbi:unnamed protein product [Sphagnum compactum]